MTELNDKAVLKKTADVPFRIIEGEAVLVNTKTHEVIHINDTGTFVWENLDGSRDLGTIIAALVAEFEVDEATAREDVRGFASELIEKGLIAASSPACDPA